MRKLVVVVLIASFTLAVGGVAEAQSVAVPRLTLEAGEARSAGEVSTAVQMLIVLTVLSLAPAILLMLTSFTRIVIVLSLLRQAVGTGLREDQRLTGLGIGVEDVRVVAVRAERDVEKALQTPTREMVQQAADKATAGAVVRATGITRVYGEGDTAVHALNGCSLTIDRGNLTAVMGPSGSGKSTMMHILAGLDRPTEGTVSIEGHDITKLNDNELTKIRREHIGFIFQFFNLLPMLTAEENIRLPLELAGGKIDKEWVDEVIKRTGLDDRRRHRPSELSGGQQQRVAIARALASRPTVIFADEPTGNLDSATSGEILDLLREMVADFNQTVVMVTHDARAAAIANRILFLADGCIVKELKGASQTEIVAAMDEVARQ